MIRRNPENLHLIINVCLVCLYIEKFLPGPGHIWVLQVDTEMESPTQNDPFSAEQFRDLI